MRRIRTDLSVAAMLALTACITYAGTHIPRDIDQRKGPKVYQLGNSHTDSMREELAGLAGKAGHMTYAYGTHTIPGAPLRWLAGHPRDSFEHLKNHAWDVVTLQSYNSTTEDEVQAAIKYTAAAMEGNPDVRIMMYSIWPNEENWDTPSLGRSEKWTEKVAQRIRQALPKAKVSVAPTSLVIRRVGNAIDAGLVPGLTSRRDLYNDPGHMGPNGAYAISATFCAMIFQESPIGYPSAVLDTRNGGPGDNVAFDIGKDTAAAIQRIVWDTLAEYQHDGVDTGMVINASHLPPGVVGLAYDQPLPVVNSPGKVDWTIKAGKLPEGLRLTDGRIIGTPKETAEAQLTLLAKAGDETARRTVTLHVDADRDLMIPVQPKLSLRVARDAYIYHPFQADGAIGRVRWSIAAGELPKGLLLTDGGLLMGTCGEKGTFPVTLRARDRHPTKPRTADRELTFEVGPAGKGAVLAAKGDAKQWKQDGKLDEDFWSFDHVLKGAGGKECGRFSVVWGEDATNRRPAKTRDLYIAVKLDSKTCGDIPLESIHLYFDFRHNRELIYNEDDLHWMTRVLPEPVKTRRGDMQYHSDEVIQGYKNARALDEAVTINKDGSWVMEVEVSRKAFAGRGVHTKFGPNVTYGFELAVGSKDDPAKRIYYFSGPKAETDTSVFGSIVLEP